MMAGDPFGDMAGIVASIVFPMRQPDRCVVIQSSTAHPVEGRCRQEVSLSCLPSFVVDSACASVRNFETLYILSHSHMDEE